jgi:hypothetical protein
MNYLYVFIDVSGNYDFSPAGTMSIVITSTVCSDINPGVLELYAVKHEVIDQGIDIEYFHAAEDRQPVRDRVFNVISGLTNIRIDSIIVEKSKVDPSLRPLNRLYPTMVEYLLQYPFDPRGIDVTRFDKVLIFMDRESARPREKEALTKAVKLSLARHSRGVPYALSMHSSASHPYLQIVDYCSWAVYVKWERGELRPFNQIKNLVKSEFLIYQNKKAKWY